MASRPQSQHQSDQYHSPPSRPWSSEISSGSTFSRPFINQPSPLRSSPPGQAKPQPKVPPQPSGGGLRRPSFEHFFSGDEEDQRDESPEDEFRRHRNHSLSDVVEASEYHDQHEKAKYKPSPLRPPTQAPGDDGPKSTLRTRRSQLSRGDTITTQMGPKSMQDITDAFGVEGAARPISKTFIRPSPPQELLDYPAISNPRVTMNIFIMSPLYVGGGAVDGRLNIHIRGTKRDDIRLGRIAIDIVGIEELSFTHKSIFFNVATELIDNDHPPPATMLLPVESENNVFWRVQPCRASVPFHMSLPLKVGPGPFVSTRARIRYVIHGTVLLSINGSKVVVRCCRDLRMISALDPERALLALESPLIASEERALIWGGQKTLKLTAALQRAVWVSGTAAYVDVSIVNNTSRRVRKLKVKLLRNIVAYKTTVALADKTSAAYMRTPSWIDRKTIAHSELNIGTRWRGVKGNQVDVVTCEIEIPRNQMSIEMGA
ncbi:hypothetical protein DFH27DRAFT_618724 [Peziza echinospora]|nr:hypothetical protein DFH27DRAFT_618724 [Peziza echinospora]